MNFSSFLSSFGLNPEDYEEYDSIGSESEGTTTYLLREARIETYCQSCGCENHVHHRYVTTKRFRPHRLAGTEFIVERIVYRCSGCRRYSTRPLAGIRKAARMTSSEVALLREDLQSGPTFTEVAASHGITVARAIQLFDELFPKVGRGKLPRILCIDEIRFDDSDEPYCCVLMDFETQMPVDIIRSRRKEWLDEYFSSMKPGELRNVEYVISDMFDGYSRMARTWFPRAVHVVDRFHVIQLVRNAVNVARARVMKSVDQDSPEYRFMKSNWESFLVRKSSIPDKWYGRNGYSQGIHYDEMVRSCLRLSDGFLIAWGLYQDILSMSWGEDPFEHCLGTVDFNARRLAESAIPEVSKAGESFRKWRVPIANAMAKNGTGYRLTNGRMECMNNHLKTIVKKAYGYGNFDRFRRRCLLLLRYKKEGA